MMLVIRSRGGCGLEDIPDRECAMLSVDRYSLVDSKK